MAGRADTAARRKGVRRGRERGCWLYVPAETLEALGWSRDDPPPYSMMWPDPKRPRLLVNLYREK